MQTNNKLREALTRVKKIAASYINCHDDEIDRVMTEIVATCDSALAEPVRNCDTNESIDAVVKRFKAENCDHYDNAFDDPRTQCHQNCVECVIKWMMANRIKEDKK